ncbi:MAG TPA: hypothetical protein VFM94_02035 [Solirubrobacterales bacterium]|nr:hypothetical protein [Solirubrobacterales bacterium]
MPVAVPDVLTFATLTEAVSASAGTIVVITGVSAGGFRAATVLWRFPPDRVEWMTAAGFVCGVVVTILLVFVDKILQGG